ncbi:MAG: aminotransferase class III-fold pyridoxal phosphate-dependent enzyme [Candidatus Margulisbacteria bacterium]|jgi:4-aminobutyrate aminotransferase|nr:aminotransferase class III-fold pyridoxal phosphate-dependent enzyme [Candidatus Margulisiibacteriota bacterium]
MNLVERSDRVLSRVLSHFTELEIERGSGSYLYGLDGKAYLDFASGIAVTGTGHCHPEVVRAAMEQLKKLIHNCAGVTYASANIELAEKLQKIVPIKDARFFLTQSGSEAVEGALKAAKYVSGKSGIIALQGGFHGRTMGALSVTTSKKSYTDGYGELLPHTFIAAPDLDSVAKLNNGNIAAVITELVRGEGGYSALDREFIRQLRAYCSEKNIYLIIDEVQSGFGRTGKMFAAEWFDLEPDIMSLAKGIASGFPLGAVVLKKAISDAWKPSAHGGTYTGNPVACAAGVATLDILTGELPRMPAKIKAVEEACDRLIAKYPRVFIRRQGLGYMIGLVCASGGICGALRQAALAQGLLLISSGSGGEVVRLAYPVTASIPELEKGFALLDRAAGEL